ncbi:MAG: peptidylprolyl isomerase [Armatimonadetes bacterium]|nr:peptidylprolyl isomerase [Armatimonadota bacterium]
MRFSLRVVLGVMVMVLGVTASAAPLKKPVHKTITKTAPKAVSKHHLSSPGLPNNVVATVNSVPITRQQVMAQIVPDQLARIKATSFPDRVRPLAASIGTLMLERLFSPANHDKPIVVSEQEVENWLFKERPSVLTTAIQDLIRARLIHEAAVKNHIVVTPAEIAARMHLTIEKVKKQMSQPQLADLEVLKMYGVRELALEEATKTQLELEKLVLLNYEKKIGHTIGPDDFIQARHILIRVNPGSTPQATDDAYAAAKIKIDQIRQDIISGKIKFSKAAEKYSDDGASKLRGGDLGVFVRGAMVKPFDEAAFNLKPGIISEPVKTEFGWHLIEVTRLGSDISQGERDQALQQFLQNQYGTEIADLMKSAKVINRYPPKPTQSPVFGSNQ